MKKIYFLTFLLFALLANVWSQTTRVTGQVINAQGEGIPFATITVEGSKTSVSADANGNFEITASPSATLLVTSAGLQPVQMKVGNQSNLIVSLSTTNPLQEVVVTALGITRQAKSLGYSAQQVSGSELTKARETNIVNSLAGKIAGVRVTSQSGTLGGSSRIQIRGASSLGSSSQPIFVVDGLPVDNGSPSVSTSSGAAPTGSASIDFGNRASDINPDDIESISVLKGASATALYGARAKNGAIIVTTKRGKKGQTSVTLNSSTRFDNVLKLPSFQNEYAQGSFGQFLIGSTNGWGPKISEVSDLTFVNFLGEQETLKAYPDNVKDFYETGNTYINSVAFDGGNDNSDYRLSYTSSVQDGVTPNQSLVKNAITLNAGRKISEKMSARAAISYTGTNAKGRPTQSSNDPNILGNVINLLPRTVDIHKLKDNYLDPETGQQNTLTPARNGNNPYWIINNNGFSGNVDRAYGNTVLNYKPFSWLNISNNLGLDFYNEFRKGVTRNGTVGALTGNFLEANIFNRTINNDLIVTGNASLSQDLGLKVLVGGNIYETFYRRTQSQATDLTIDKLYSFSNAASVITTNTSNRKRIVGVYGEAEFNYKEFLYLSVTGRNDWSSTLPLENRSYFYPAVSASFIFSEFLKPSWFSYGKLRASYANVGSDENPYLTDFYYTPQSAAFAQYGFGVTFPFNGALAVSIPITRPAYNLKPQNQASFEIGTELRFLNNRITVDFTYYNSVTKDQIIALAVPNSTGFRTSRLNAGTVTNNGYEVQLGLVPVKTRNFTWNIDGNFSANKQSVSDLPPDVLTYTLASGWSSLQVRAEPGKQFGLYGTGWVRDDAGEIVIDQNTGLRATKADVRLGNLYPDWMLGINNSFNFKGFNLSFLVDIRNGGSIYSNTAASLRSSGLGIETLGNRGQIFIDKGVNVDEDGKSTPNTVPVQSVQDFWAQNFQTQNTEANIFDASYVKLRELRLSYSLPAKIFNRGLKFVKGVELGLEGRNLWIIHDNVPHIDPEVNFFANSAVGEGVEFNSVPSTRTLGFNVRFKF